MQSTVVGLVVLGCVFGGALLGMGLRAILPEHHLRDDTKDIVKLGMGLVATMTALVLGLLVASAKDTYDAQKTGLEQISANVVLLDVVLAEYGPEAVKMRQRLRDVVNEVSERFWPESGADNYTAPSIGSIEGTNVLGQLLNLAPNNDKKRALQAQAVQIALELAHVHWLMAAHEKGEAIPVPFIVILACWLTLLFGSFGLFAPANATVVVALLLSALSVSGAVVLIIELSRPFQGMMQISGEPFRTALAPLAP